MFSLPSWRRILSHRFSLRIERTGSRLPNLSTLGFSILGAGGTSQARPSRCISSKFLLIGFLSADGACWVGHASMRPVAEPTRALACRELLPLPQVYGMRDRDTQPGHRSRYS